MDEYRTLQGYSPIQTNADRRSSAIGRFLEGVKGVIGIEGSVADHLKHRLSPWTITKEVVNHVTDKVIPHGADEIGNVLFSGSAYLPWPGAGGPKPIPPPASEPVPQITNDSSPSVGGPDIDDDPYMTGGYEPQPEPTPGGPSGMYLGSYQQAKEDAADRAGFAPSEGHTR